MRTFPIPALVLAPALMIALALPASALAQGAPTAKSIGVFENWQAATYVDNGQTVCYAFTRPLIGGKVEERSGGSVLSIAERPGMRDSIAIAVGYNFASGAEVSVSIGRSAHQEFYTSGSSAFSRDGSGLISAMKDGTELTSISPGPGHGSTTNHFSLKGFTAAYDAIVKACPR